MARSVAQALLGTILAACIPGFVGMLGREQNSMTGKCFWCGANNDPQADYCENCSRKLQWSYFFKALLRPSVGYLLGEERQYAGSGSGYDRRVTAARH